MINFIKKVSPYLFIVIITILTFFYVYRAWGFNLNKPYFYRGDDLWNIAGIKGFIEQGNFYENRNLGAPFGNNNYDYPSSETIFKIPIILLSFFVKNPVVIINVYYLLTFIITAFSSYFVLNYFKVTNKISILASLIIAFLPYHLLKGTSHINLSTYYLIPFIFLVLFWIFNNQIKIRFSINKNNKLMLSVIIIALIGNNGIYYAFFTSFFLIVTGLLSCFRDKKFKNLFISVFLSLIIFLTVFLNILPNIIHQIRFGRNQLVATRSYNEAEYYGLKIIELFLPTSNFKSDIIRKYKERYNNFTLTKSEGSSYLGIIGCIGFIILVLNLFTKKSYDKRVDFLSYLNLSALFLSIPTGLGTMIGYLTAQIRVYSRISIFINIFSIFALVFIADKSIKKYKINKFFLIILLGFIFIIAIIDQGIPKDINAQGILSLYSSDKHFVEKVENKLNHQGMIFQLPYKAFPETGPINQLTDYDLFRGYIHSKKLKWSYGIIKGTRQDQWIKNIFELPINQLVKTVTIAGYNGIYYDTVGYTDRGKNLESQLTDILQEESIKSDLNDLVFFDLTNYRQKLTNELGKEQMEIQKKQILSLPLQVTWGKGFYLGETDGQDTWYWSNRESSIIIINDNKENRDAVLEFYPVSNFPETSNLYIESDLLSKNLKINGQKKLFRERLKIQPGRYQVKFKTNSKKVESPNEVRDLYFRLFNFCLKEL